MDKEKIKKAIIELLKAIDEDPNRPGLKKTPERIANMCEELFSGKKRDVSEILQVIHDLEHDEMVLLRGIPFYSICEHHLLPFFGECHIAYIPNKNSIVGISKLVRLVDVMSNRLQVQERLTTVIADMLMKHLNPKGVAVVIKARHLCMEMRGVKKPIESIITSAVRGSFRKDMRTRDEFLKLIG